MGSSFVSPTIRVITISGRVASGATTLSRALSECLGWKLINGGEMYREYARKQGIALEKTTISSDQYHRELDDYIKEKLKNERELVLESWLAGFDAKEIEGVFKIYVECPDDAVRIDRLVNRDHMSVEAAKEHLTTREEENLKKWEMLYHTRDFWNPRLYDLVIDTYTNGPEETLAIALGGIGYGRGNQPISQSSNNPIDQQPD